MQRVTSDIRMAFQLVEDAFQEISPPYLFHGAKSQIPGREITSLTFKQARIALPGPNSDRGGELDGVHHNHGTPRGDSPLDGRIQVRQP